MEILLLFFTATFEWTCAVIKIVELPIFKKFLIALLNSVYHFKAFVMILLPGIPRPLQTFRKVTECHGWAR